MRRGDFKRCPTCTAIGHHTSSCPLEQPGSTMQQAAAAVMMGKRPRGEGIQCPAGWRVHSMGESVLRQSSMAASVDRRDRAADAAEERAVSDPRAMDARVLVDRLLMTGVIAVAAEDREDIRSCGPGALRVGSDGRWYTHHSGWVRWQSAILVSALNQAGIRATAELLTVWMEEWQSHRDAEVSSTGGQR